VVAGTGFGGGANGWALDVAGFVSVELTASVVAAGSRLACWVDGNKGLRLHAMAAEGTTATYVVSWETTLTLQDLLRSHGQQGLRKMMMRGQRRGQCIGAAGQTGATAMMQR
jgi:hypothetical protein